MCGIAGIINHHPYDLNALKHSLKHRGPDDQSIYVENNLALVHTRLAIQDIANGQQPLHFAHYSIIFNGEIYNHKELRQSLSEFSFKTNSDTETLLYLYAKFGAGLFPMLDGMFAFCIYDRKKNQIVLARDRAGKKPLYYLNKNGSFIFASEINTIKAITRLDINEDAINCYLRAGFIYKPYTPYKELHKLDAATYMMVNLDTRESIRKKYYNILDSYYEKNEKITFDYAVNAADEKLKKSVKDRLLASDVEVGAFLSGGIDSNLVVAMASQFNSKLKTFTVKFDGLYDESKLAKLAAEKYQTTHTELEISMDVNNDIEKILSRYGEPFMDSSAVPSYYVAREARKSVTVVLNGDGADELFAGYRRYVPIANNMMYYMGYFSPFRNYLPKPRKKQSGYNYLYRLLCMASKTDLDFYLSATSDIYEDVFAFKHNPILEEMNDFISITLKNPKLTPLAKMLYLDFNLLLFSDLLVKMDIATMAHSLEARSPFLSRQMLNFAPRMPDRYKINRLSTKHLLRELAKKYLPAELIHQPKRGFEVPLKKWVEKDLKSKIYDSLLPGCYSEKYLDRTLIDKLLHSNHAFPDEKRAKMLWGLFCLESWYANEKNG